MVFFCCQSAEVMTEMRMRWASNHGRLRGAWCSAVHQKVYMTWMYFMSSKERVVLSVSVTYLKQLSFTLLTVTEISLIPNKTKRVRKGCLLVALLARDVIAAS